MSPENFRPVVLVPVCNSPQGFEELLDNLVDLGFPVLLVDAGSDEPHARSLDAMADARPGTSLVRLAKSEGKGAAVSVGLRVADNMYFTHVLAFEADGRYDVSQLPGLLEAARRNPDALICARRIFEQQAPCAWSRRLVNFWIRVSTKSRAPKDTLCGLRVYPLNSTLPVLPDLKARHADFVPAIAVLLTLSGIPVVNCDVSEINPRGFTCFLDAVRIAKLLVMHSCTRMLSPKKFVQNK